MEDGLLLLAMAAIVELKAYECWMTLDSSATQAWPLNLPSTLLMLPLEGGLKYLYSQVYMLCFLSLIVVKSFR